MTVAITRTDMTVGDLRKAASSCRDADASRRMLALALVLEGMPQAEAARACGMDRQTLRDWVHRYNDEGLPGLSNRGGQGRKPLLDDDRRRVWRTWCARVTHHVHILEMNGESYRLSQSRARRKS